jgi:hypothetical protein
MLTTKSRIGQSSTRYSHECKFKGIFETLCSIRDLFIGNFSIEDIQNLRLVSKDIARIFELYHVPYMYVDVKRIDSLPRVIELCEAGRVWELKYYPESHSSPRKLLQDISVFGRVIKLTLNSFTFSFLSALEDTKYLDLCNCTGFTTLHGGKLDYIFLTLCEDITTFIDVGFVRNLYICSCQQITDISMFYAVEILSIKNCNITCFGALCRIRDVYLNECHETTDISPFQNAERVAIEECNAITYVGCLRNVPYVEFLSCSALSDVSGLGCAHDMSLFGCDEVDDVDSLVNVPQLNICGTSVPDEDIYRLNLQRRLLGLSDLSAWTDRTEAKIKAILQKYPDHEINEVISLAISNTISIEVGKIVVEIVGLIENASE